MRSLDNAVKAKIHANHSRYLARARKGEEIEEIRSRFSSSFGCRLSVGLSVPILPNVATNH